MGGLCLDNLPNFASVVRCEQIIHSKTWKIDEYVVMLSVHNQENLAVNEGFAFAFRFD